MGLDLVVLTDPDYLFNERILAFLGARIQRIPLCRDGTGTNLDLDAVERACADRPGLLLLSNPSNPTGAVYRDDMLYRLAELAEQWDFRVVVDSLYCRPVYDDSVPFPHLMAQATACLFPAISALELPDQQVAARLQRDARVVVSPKYQFGSAGVGYFRVCLTRDETEGHDATEAMAEDLVALGKKQGLA
jgi:aspartate/methionine/tyrosine aminotransferase